MKNKKIIFAILICLLIVSIILSLFFWSNIISDGKEIEQTGFVDFRRPIALSNNFDVDSRENIYFASQSSPIIQIFDKNSKYLYSLDLNEQLNHNVYGAKYVRILDDDLIEVYIMRSKEIAQFNKLGFLIDEQIVESDEFTSLLHSVIPSNYRVEKNGIIYHAEPQNNFFSSIYKQDAVTNVLFFKTPIEEVLFMIFRVIAICLLIIVIIYKLVDYLRTKRLKKFN